MLQYLIKSAMEIIFKFFAFAKGWSFGNLAIEPSSSTISYNTTIALIISDHMLTHSWCPYEWLVVHILDAKMSKQKPTNNKQLICIFLFFLNMSNENKKLKLLLEAFCWTPDRYSGEIELGWSTEIEGNKQKLSFQLMVLSWTNQ